MDPVKHCNVKGNNSELELGSGSLVQAFSAGPTG